MERVRPDAHNRVLDALAAVPRASYVPPIHVGEAKLDRPIPIGAGQVTTQPSLEAAATGRRSVDGAHRLIDARKSAVASERPSSAYNLMLHAVLAINGHRITVLDEWNRASRVTLTVAADAELTPNPLPANDVASIALHTRFTRATLTGSQVRAPGATAAIEADPLARPSIAPASANPA